MECNLIMFDLSWFDFILIFRCFLCRVRQRGQKEAKVVVSKLGKLLKAFPGAVNAAGFAPASGADLSPMFLVSFLALWKARYY